MNGVASSSNPPVDLLAPGFRFHPTDEELVSYYLKRKISGRPLRFDAIAEIDIYKTEPWDLPPMSRLRSRDVEWYFFSPLDRKYTNRSRTNRATTQGYWKTTGKDRPVRHGARGVGMKKTLVFHVGRAPHGQRTNWVMHEYRLEDEELTNAKIPQDGYVVCRIFQKNGAGPQNGAQYGAPFVEEEWEESGELVLATEVGDDVVAGAEYLQLTDFEQNQDQCNQHESTSLLTPSSDGQNTGSHPEDPFLLEEIFQDNSFVNEMNAPLLEDTPTLYNGMGGNSGHEIMSHSPSSQNDGYMELNDLANAVNADYRSSEDSVDCFLGTSNGQRSLNGGDERNNLPTIDEVEEFFVNENTDSPAVFHMSPTVQDESYLGPNDLLNPMAGDYPSDRTSEDNMVFYDAHLPSAQENFVQMEDLPYMPTDDPSGFNLVDDIMAYFDNTENNLQYYTLDSSEKLQLVDSSALNQSILSPEVDGISAPTPTETTSEANAGMASSSMGLTKADNQSNIINENDTTETYSGTKKSSSGRALMGRIENMLGSYTAPVALASEAHAFPGKSLQRASAPNSASSIHVTAGMIQIHGFKVMGQAEHWSMDKNSGVRFLLSCGVARDGVVSKPGGFEPVTKMQGLTMSVVLRGGFYLFLLSALFLAICCKVGMRVCSR